MSLYYTKYCCEDHFWNGPFNPHQYSYSLSDIIPLPVMINSVSSLIVHKILNNSLNVVDRPQVFGGEAARITRNIIAIQLSTNGTAKYGTNGFRKKSFTLYNFSLSHCENNVLSEFALAVTKNNLRKIFLEKISLRKQLLFCDSYLIVVPFSN